MRKVVAGLDLTTKAGLVVVEYTGADIVPVYQGVVSSKPATLRCADRTYNIAQQIIEVLNKFGVSEVMIEDYGGRFKSSLIVLAELGGVVKLYLSLNQIKFQVVSPTMLKKFFTGKGTADKNIMIKEAYKRYGFDTDSDDIADAFALSVFALALGGADVNLPKTNLETVQDYLTPKQKKPRKTTGLS